jgi:hypothetical protein
LIQQSWCQSFIAKAKFWFSEQGLELIFGVAVRSAIFSVAVSLQSILSILQGIQILQERTKVLACITVMAFVEQVIALGKEVASSLVLLFGAVTADGATTVPQTIRFLFKQIQAIADLIKIFYIDVQAHD